jgi:DNA-binding NtrC family response regulator
MAGGNVLTLDDLPQNLLRPAGGERLEGLPLGGHKLAELEQAAIRQTLDQFDGNRTRSAQVLGVSIRTLQRKLKQWKQDARIASAV